MTQRKTRINLLDILVVLAILSIVSLVFFRGAFVLIGGITGILFLIYLVFVWDDIVVWVSTIGSKKR